jgi:serine/threonine protein kinase
MAKIADFGLAILIEAATGSRTASLTSPKGTVAWMAPERHSFDGPVLRLAPSMDVYSFGMICITVRYRKDESLHVLTFGLGLDATASIRRPE